MDSCSRPSYDLAMSANTNEREQKVTFTCDRESACPCSYTMNISADYPNPILDKKGWIEVAPHENGPNSHYCSKACHEVSEHSGLPNVSLK